MPKIIHIFLRKEVDVLLSTILCMSKIWADRGPFYDPIRIFSNQTEGSNYNYNYYYQDHGGLAYSKSPKLHSTFQKVCSNRSHTFYPVSAHCRSSNSAKVNSAPSTPTNGQGFNISISLTLPRQVPGISQISNCSTFSIVCPSIRQISQSVVFLFSYSRLPNLSFFLAQMR